MHSHVLPGQLFFLAITCGPCAVPPDPSHSCRSKSFDFMCIMHAAREKKNRVLRLITSWSLDVQAALMGVLGVLIGLYEVYNKLL